MEIMLIKEINLLLHAAKLYICLGSFLQCMFEFSWVSKCIVYQSIPNTFHMHFSSWFRSFKETFSFWLYKLMMKVNDSSYFLWKAKPRHCFIPCICVFEVFRSMSSMPLLCFDFCYLNCDSSVTVEV